MHYSHTRLFIEAMKRLRSEFDLLLIASFHEGARPRQRHHVLYSFSLVHRKYDCDVHVKSVSAKKASIQVYADAVIWCFAHLNVSQYTLHKLSV